MRFEMTAKTKVRQSYSLDDLYNIMCTLYNIILQSRENATVKFSRLRDQERGRVRLQFFRLSETIVHNIIAFRRVSRRSIL